MTPAQKRAAEKAWQQKLLVRELRSRLRMYKRLAQRLEKRLYDAFNKGVDDALYTERYLQRQWPKRSRR